MTHPSSILIIGAGLIGVSCADSLVRSGAQITVIDSHSGPARQASFANSGMIHPSQACPWNTERLLPLHAAQSIRSVYELAQRSKTLIQGRAVDLGLNQVTRADGCLQLFKTKAQRDAKAKLYEKDNIAFSVFESGVESFNRPALFFEGDISGNAFDYCNALESRLKKKGVAFRYDCQVSDVSRNTSGKLEVKTSGETFCPDHIVIAAGEASAEILRPLGIILKTYPERGFAMDFNKPELNSPKTPIMDAASKSALTVFDDRIRLSGTIGETSAETLLKVWTEIAPDFISNLGQPFQTWSSNRPMSTIGRPYIGQTSLSGLWVNTGHGHMGWTLSAGSGELLAKMMLDDFSDERFAIA